ncbi:MAG: hypothetical protein KA116_11500 [Proteobacteria bacterium]|nr:hypothetical protein [Pseudomonadota bacterium]
MKKQKNNEVSIREAPAVYVGMGPCGLASLALESNESCLFLESEHTHLGRASEAALHLVNANLESTLLAPSPTLESPLIRWERQWVSPDNVDWKDPEWSQELPQWKFYFEGPKKIALWNKELLSQINSKITYSSPVSFLNKSEDKWTLHTPKEEIITPKIIWGAGIRAFQNAFGKIESQEFLQANPNFNDDTREFLGGIALTWTFPKAPTFVEAFPEKHLWGLPVKHDKKYYLSLGAIHQDDKGFHISTITYLPDEIVQNPKELTSFHKSLKRSLKAQLDEAQEPFQHETLVHNPHLLGHTLGLHWVFKDDHNGIHFIGDETHRAASKNIWGLNSLDLL